ncbi:hypothetical protein QAD02_007335 [Eretmocerus hayati]|uniref:Uncharacterized protein n=1 Tax=Eretmocerus hayati TaxID=131215 RepID=A0ACC2N4L8_9HYME|nr:hypothetical protein QAD02_007335 [Eretmocerus hayati]
MIDSDEELIPILNQRAGFPEHTELVLYEEIKPNMVERIENLAEPLEKVLEELMDGDIIVFQKEEAIGEVWDLPTCRDYFRTDGDHPLVDFPLLIFSALTKSPLSPNPSTDPPNQSI